MCYHHDDFDETCRDAKKLQDKLDDVRDFFEGVLNVMYSKEPINQDFEVWLEEIAYKLDLKLPIAELQIQRRNNDLGLISHYLLNLQKIEHKELV